MEKKVLFEILSDLYPLFQNSYDKGRFAEWEIIGKTMTKIQNRMKKL